MELLKSKNFSLACAILNGAFTVQALCNGSWFWGLICMACCGYCANNYKNAE